jgi:hypothetical protein
MVVWHVNWLDMHRDTPQWTTAKLSQLDFSNHLHLSVTAGG